MYKESRTSKELFKLNQIFLSYKFNRYANPKGNTEKVHAVVQKFCDFIKMILGHTLPRGQFIYPERPYHMMDKPYAGVLPRIVVYTCVFGGYDDISDPAYISPYCDYAVITDQEISDESIWEKYDISNIHIPHGLDHSMKNRFIKMHPHLLFPDYDISIYVDGSVVVMTDMVPLALQMGNKFLGIHLHRDRNTIRDEGKAVIKLKKVKNIDLLKKQIHDYYQSGYDDSLALLEAPILVRRHNETICKKVMNDWWNELQKYEHRDQISLPYVLWKNGVSLQDIYIIGNSIELNPRFYWKGHNQ